MIKLVNDDFKNFVPTLEDNSIDAIITDIPYCISKDNNFSTMKDRPFRQGIDFGEWDKDFDINDLKLLVPKLKKGGTLFVFHSFEQYSDLLNTFDDLEFKDRVIWRKTNPMPRNRDRRYVCNIEIASWYVKHGKNWTFNRQSDTYDECVLSYPTESNHYRIHPTQKNFDLMIDIVKRHTNKGDLVLDCFMGSGATGIACALTDRNFIGVERNKDYFDKASQKIEESIPVFMKNSIKIERPSLDRD